MPGRVEESSHIVMFLLSVDKFQRILKKKGAKYNSQPLSRSQSSSYMHSEVKKKRQEQVGTVTEKKKSFGLKKKKKKSLA